MVETQSRPRVMVWAVLILITVVLLVHWWFYRRSVQEYTFVAPSTLERRGELTSTLSELTPVAVELGALPWRPTVAEQASWVVSTDGGDMPISEWMKRDADIRNGAALAEQMELSTGLTDIVEARPWWWLPGTWDSEVGVLRKGESLGFGWVGSERRWIGCSHGAPLTVWLVHSRYRPYLPTTDGYDPWSLTVADAPWIGRVQYVEVMVKPGWALGIPAHWGYAVKSEANSWWWHTDQHSVMSWMITSANSQQPQHPDEETIMNTE